MLKRIGKWLVGGIGVWLLKQIYDAAVHPFIRKPQEAVRTRATRLAGAMGL